METWSVDHGYNSNVKFNDESQGGIPMENQ
jgi:hypothetical protein